MQAKTLIAGCLTLSVLLFSGLKTNATETNSSSQLDKKLTHIVQKVPKEAKACIMCHKKRHPALVNDWAKSKHASVNITCLDCHRAERHGPDVNKAHFEQYERSDMKWGQLEYRVPIATVVTPKDCSRCHPSEVAQYGRSKHANTLEIIWKIDPWLNKGMNSDWERTAGCLYCHGTVLETNQAGELTPKTWPNVGVGRVNLDDSLGSCTSCHTRHRFSIMEARKPEACGQCHLGPDHPQIEIYMESKHGDIYTAFGDEYNWDAAPGSWTPGVDYRGPTCASCHMSGSGQVQTTHDASERLSWELQAPLTVRPKNFDPWPAKTSWQTERKKMKKVCTQCHAQSWVGAHYIKLDKSVQDYNEVYFKPAKAMLDKLYAKDLLDNSKSFDEKLEVEFYELWHHEGRRARMGTAMMAPDYSWWHGFYECKHRFNEFMAEARHLLETGDKAHQYQDFPNANGDTRRPKKLFKKQE